VTQPARVFIDPTMVTWAGSPPTVS